MTPSTATAPIYSPSEIEPRWQARWAEAGIFEAEPSAERPNWVVIELPPFANGALHLGHVRNYVLADTCARFRRAAGYNVLYTSGFDSFGLPSELAALEAGRHPADLVADVMATMRREFIALGLSHDPRRIIGYHVPEYYRWIQWVFLRLFERGLAYRADVPMPWCPSCAATLAESLVTDDRRCWRCATPVVVRCVPQWLISESAFAEELLQGLDRLPRWPPRVKQIHRDWIGRRDGIELTLAVVEARVAITVFVADAAVLPAAALVVVAPDHSAVEQIRRAGALSGAAANRLQHMAAATRVTGDVTVAATQADAVTVLLDVHVTNPVTGALIPLAVCNALDRRSHDGAALLAPAHSEADVRLCAQAGIRDRMPPQPGSSPLPPAPNEDAASITARLESIGLARRASQYRLRDWNIARQRFWGPPVPIVHCPQCGIVPVPDSELPVVLPDEIELSGEGNPLARMPAFVHTTCPACGTPSTRDTDTLEAYSSPWWYHWNCKPTEREDPFDKADARRYMPVDLMIGGLDQARTCFFHLRMMARALRLAGIVEHDEPVDGLVAIGMVTNRGEKMSKSAGNTIRPAEVIHRYGVDALRLAVIEASAPEHDVSWTDERPRNASRFLRRIWDLCVRSRDRGGVGGQIPSLARQLETATARITRALAHHEFHLAAKNLRLLVDRLESHEHRPHTAASGAGDDTFSDAIRTLVRLTAPLCPHIAEELWQVIGENGLVAAAPWPLSPVPRWYPRE